MRHAVVLFSLLLVGSCKYESPLVVEPGAPVDPQLLGSWHLVAEDGKTAHELLILPYSDKEYLVHYPVDDGIYYRAYVSQLGGRRVVQLQIIGSHDDAIVDNDAFHVAEFELADGVLEVRLLNEELVSDDLVDEALRAAFVEHRTRADLFVDPARFERSVEGASSR